MVYIEAATLVFCGLFLLTVFGVTISTSGNIGNRVSKTEYFFMQLAAFLLIISSILGLAVIINWVAKLLM